jgi:hypothetical protein
MSKRARMKWPPRTRVSTKGQMRITKVAPLYGPANAIPHHELHARLVNGKAY